MYQFDSGITVRTDDVSEHVADIYNLSVPPTYVLFGAMDGWSFQHFVQDVWYIINAFRTCLERNPKAVIGVPAFPEAESLVRMIGLDNRVQLLAADDWCAFGSDENVLVAAFASKSVQQLMLTSMPLRSELWRRIPNLGAHCLEKEEAAAYVILVTRHEANARSWDNEKELRARLELLCQGHGVRLVVFAPHETPNNTVESSMALFQGAQAVVAVHGGAAYHVVACRHDALFIEVTVPESFSFDWWIASTEIRFERVETETGHHNDASKRVRAPERVFEALQEHLSTAVHRNDVHVVMQPYRDPHPERDWEIMETLRLNLNHPSVCKVHALLEEQTNLPPDVSTHPKLVSPRNQPRLTFENAFDYARNTFHDGDIVVVVNADIYLGSGDWQSLGDDGKVNWLSRWDKHPNGTISMLYDTFCRGNSSDAWAFRMPLRRGAPDDCDFRIGNQLGCDGAVAERLLRKGYLLANDALRFQVIHLDKCAHRNRLHTSHYCDTANVSSETTMYDHNSVFSKGSASVRVLCDDKARLQRLQLCEIKDRAPVEMSAEIVATALAEQRNVFVQNANHLLHQTNRIVLVHAVSGLANRIKAIVSAIRMMENNPLLVYMHKWPLDDREDASWERLFDVPLQTISTEWIVAHQHHHSGWRLELTAADKELVPPNFASIRKFGGLDARWQHIDFEYFRIPKTLRERYAETFRLLKPRRHIEEAVDSFLQRHAFLPTDHTLGVQLRLWNDAPERRCGSMIDEVIDAVDRFTESQKGKTTRIFLASDTPHEALAAIPNAVMFDGAAGGLLSKLEVAWCEMLILSKMETLIVTRSSTFGEVAWWLGGATAPVFAQIGNGE